MSARIILGHITGVHGIRGDVVVRSYTADPSDLSAYGPLGDETGANPVTVTSLRVTPKGVIVRFKGLVDRTAAEALKGRALTVAREALPPPSDDEFYHADLIGMEAFSPDGARVGTVVAVQNFGAGDLLEVRLVGSRVTEFVPFNDPHVPTIDTKGKRLTVIMPIMVGDPEPAQDDEPRDAEPGRHG